MSIRCQQQGICQTTIGDNSLSNPNSEIRPFSIVGHVEPSCIESPVEPNTKISNCGSGRGNQLRGGRAGWGGAGQDADRSVRLDDNRPLFSPSIETKGLEGLRIQKHQQRKFQFNR